MPEPEAGSEEGIQRYAILENIGRVRVITYHGNGSFFVLDSKDDIRLVNRRRLTFLPSRGPSPS